MLSFLSNPNAIIRHTLLILIAVTVVMAIDRNNSPARSHATDYKNSGLTKTYYSNYEEGLGKFNKEIQILILGSSELTHFGITCHSYNFSTPSKCSLSCNQGRWQPVICNILSVGRPPTLSSSFKIGNYCLPQLVCRVLRLRNSPLAHVLNLFPTPCWVRSCGYLNARQIQKLYWRLH